MTVLILIPQLPVDLKSIKGGVHSALVNLLEGFASLDIQIEVISFSKEVGSAQIVKYAPNIHIHYEHEGVFPFHALNYFFKGSSITKKYIKKFKPDIIHYEEGNSFLLAGFFISKKPTTILTIHGMANEEAKRKTRFRDRITWRFNGWLQQQLLPKNIIHLSAFSRKYINSKNINQETIIPNAIVSDYFDLPIREYGGNKLIYIGVIDNNKNLIHLLRAMHQLVLAKKIFTLDVLGDFNQPEYKEMIMDFILRHGLSGQVFFRGWVNQKEVKHYLSQCDILVVSSKHESLPMVIAEAKAASKVVVASNVGGIPEMIQHGQDGFLFNIQHDAELFDILSELYLNQDLIRTISSNAQASAKEKQHSTVVAQKTKSFYQICLEAEFNK